MKKEEFMNARPYPKNEKKGPKSKEMESPDTDCPSCGFTWYDGYCRRCGYVG